MGLGKAAGHAVGTFSKSFIDVTALPDISGLRGHVCHDIMVKVALVSKGAFPFLNGKKKVTKMGQNVLHGASVNGRSDLHT